MPNATMQALIQTSYGPPSQVLKIDTVPLPTFDPASNTLLIRVRAVSLNPMDYMLVRGALKAVIKTPMPARVGVDLSGVVVKAGRGTRFKEGDEVMGGMDMRAMGSLAEYCVTEAKNCVLKPGSITHEEAACLPVVGLTAVQALRRHTGQKDIAFIPGGMGGVGHVALQLAKSWAGFRHTITTVSTSKVPLVKQHIKDVDEVIDYKSVDPATVIPANSVDFVLDHLGKPASYVRFMRKAPAGKGKPSIISIASPPDGERAQAGWGPMPFYFRWLLTLMDKWVRFWIPGWIHYDSFFGEASQEDLRIVVGLAGEGKVRPFISIVFGLDQAVDAFALAETKPAGKVVITIP